MRPAVASGLQPVEIRCWIPGEGIGWRRGRGPRRPIGWRELGEAMPPSAVGVRTLPLFSVVFQVAGHLGRGIVGEPLAHEGRHAGYMRRGLAGAAET